MGGRSQGGAALLRSVLPLVLLLTAGLLSGVAHAGPVGGPSLQVFITASPSNVTVGGTVEFNSTVSGVASPSFVHYNWSFGDGVSFGGLGPHYAAPAHIYSTPGELVASVNASEAGSSRTASITVTVLEANLTVTVSASVLRGPAPLTVVFQGSVSGGSGTYVSEVWDFGDGHNGSGLHSVPNTYTAPGTYVVQLNVTDSNGASETADLEIVVTPAAASPPSDELSTWVPVLLLAVAIVLVAFGIYRSRTALARRRLEDDLLERAAHRAATTPKPKVEKEVPQEPSAVPEPASVPSPPPTPAKEPSPAPTPTPEVPSSPPSTDQTPEAPSTSSPGPEASAVPEVPASNANDEPAPAKKPMKKRPAVQPDTLRLSLRLVVHIAAQGSVGPHDVAPASLTQAGMAEAFGTKQNTIATLLKRLEVGGMVVSDVRHVRGGARRMKVYRLTTRGEALAREVRSRPPRRPKSDEPGEPDA